MVLVASRAVDGGSRPSARWITGRLTAPGHWWPAPAMVTSSTALPCGQSASDVVTGPATVTDRHLPFDRGDHARDEPDIVHIGTSGHAAAAAAHVPGPVQPVRV